MASDQRPGLNPGQKAQLDHVVTRADLAGSVQPGSVAVLSTPAMIALMERAALEAAQPHLLPGETTVGVRLEVDHLDACLLGTGVVAEAELLRVEGRRLRFAVAVKAGERLLGQGFHDRAVIDEAKFLARLKERLG